eukprot:3991443-Amphidinium_carterae.1
MLIAFAPIRITKIVSTAVVCTAIRQRFSISSGDVCLPLTVRQRLNLLLVTFSWQDQSELAAMPASRFFNYTWQIVTFSPTLTSL